MFIKLTIVRIEEKNKEVLLTSLVNTDDIKALRHDPGTNKVYVVYKTYSEIGEEEDEIKEDVKTVAARMIKAGVYIPEA